MIQPGFSCPHLLTFSYRSATAPGWVSVSPQGAFQFLNHDHTVNPVHERDIRVYNISTACESE